MSDTKKLTCLIIEDEPIAAEVLQDYIGQVSSLELRGTCTDAIYALEYLNQQPVDVIFLDIHLPKLKGLEFLKILKQKPQTILTTAYHQYALDAFDAAVVDYLMKPIEFSRFLQAVNKLQWPPPPVVSATGPATGVRAYQFFQVNKKSVRVYFDEVLYLESLKDYCRLVTTSQSLVIRGQIGELETIFLPHGFLRIHRSYLVALDHISAFSAGEIEVGSRQFPIGRSYKELVERALRKM